MLATEKKILFDFFNATHEHLSQFKNQNKANIVFSDDVADSKNINSPEDFSETKVTQKSLEPLQFANENFSATSIEELSEKMRACKKCSLCNSRKNLVAGTGVLNPLVLVIGEAPGADEDAQGLPFVGKAGVLLDKMLASISLSRTTNCYIANILKCRPPENRDPLPEEQASCFPFLDAQIHLLKPTAILLLGRIATQKILNTKGSLSRLHGIFFDYKTIPVLATYHPSALLRDESLKGFAWNDLKNFRSKLAKLSSTYAKAILQK